MNPGKYRAATVFVPSAREKLDAKIEKGGRSRQAGPSFILRESVKRGVHSFVRVGTILSSENVDNNKPAIDWPVLSIMACILLTPVSAYAIFA
jgi:hypothetical protein